MLNISDEVKKVSASFFQYRNDLDIYTEDKQDSKEFYKTLLKRLLNDTSIKINDVTPIGCKADVIKFCKNDQNDRRKKLYIVDGDINIIDGSIETHEDLFVLNAYCIENFIVDVESVSSYIYLSCGTKSIDNIINILSYENWLNMYSSKLIDLFLHFALVNKIGLRFMLYNANKFLVKGVFDESLVDNDIANLKQEILKNISSQEYDAIIYELRTKWKSDIDNLLIIVSGKDYLIPIVLSKLVEFKTTGSKPSLDEAKMHLLLLCNLDRLNDLKNRIVAVANA